MIGFLKPAPHIERLPKDKIDSTYKRYRIQMFISIYIGYAVYYFVRSNFSIAKNYMITQLGFTKTELGFIASGLGIAYGISKFIMGSFSDRSNPRFFLGTGLILSGLANVFMGMTASIPILFVLWTLNGWFQGMGWPPCGRTMTHWFSDKERGVKMSIWNTAHNIGGALIATVAVIGVTMFSGSYKGAFTLPGIIAIVAGVLFMIFAKDTPQSVGLPPIEEYKNDYPKFDVAVEDAEKELTAKEIFFKYVLNNKYLWIIAIANLFVYLVRYGVLNWAPVYLKEVRGFNPKEAGLAFALFEYAAIPGTIIVGWISDKVFNGRRAPAGVFCMLGVAVATYVYWKSTSFMAINIALASIGALIYGPVMLIGVAALDLVPKKAAGTAAGFTGLFGYMGGSVLAEILLGAIVDGYGWDGGFMVLVASSILSVVFLAFTWNVHDTSSHEEKELAS
ncbi:phosphoglycerate transporter protein PgtP [Clostridium sp. ZS2-4]|uniref:phosphoglycerate transporter protein PgtP n=1 Tax=Clostridium sp. ZS2-4 TaxID=2987703 RepID=UPI00227D290B|nr:phosphoglycerate transporter protein PgtP [Clostridium sp. ZS2-4]MCY6356693.1 phosphoglycerate transporter protein PgtP [Clostridium sp. ZS2-4]